MTAITTTITISVSFICYFLPARAYSSFSFRSERTHRNTKIAANAARNTKPPRKPAPKEPVVSNVPIW